MSQNDNQNQDKQQNNQGGNQQGPSPAPPAGNRIMVFYLIIFGLLLFWLIFTWSDGFYGEPQLEYSTFREQLKQGNIEEVLVQGERMDVKLRDPIEKRLGDQDETTRITEFHTYIPSFGDEEILSLIESHEVTLRTEPESDGMWWYLLFAGLPFLLLIFLAFIFFQRMQSQGQGFFNIGKSQAKRYDPNDGAEKTTFKDVAGAREAKQELQEVVDYLKEPERFKEMGVKVPKGVLLMGPPGTGKTLLGRAVAGEAGVPFFSITGSDFMEMFVGVGAKRVRDMFKQAKEAGSSIIFIDELDSIGRRRGAGVGGGHDEREQTLNQLLAELDGFEKNDNIVVMGATNRPDILDKALLRPGRFNRRVTVDLPTVKDREAILKVHSRKKQLYKDVDLNEVARGTPGFSGADLENLMNEAAILAARNKRKRIRKEDIDEARDKVTMGLTRSAITLDEEEKEMIAYHEAGHAIVAAVLPHSDPLHKVTIVPRGQAMGVTQQLPEKEKFLYRREYLLDRLAVIMGGRAAEDVVYNTATSGAENDLKQVTKLARKMVLDWGMSDKFRHTALGGQQDEVFLGEQMGTQREYSDQTAREADEEVKKILEEAYDRAIDTLRQHRKEFDELARMLIEKEEVSGKQVKALFNPEQQQVDGSSKDAQKEVQHQATRRNSSSGDGNAAG